MYQNSDNDHYNNLMQFHITPSIYIIIMIQDIRISEALFRLSSFKLKGILKYQIAKMKKIPLLGVSNQQLQKLIFSHFIMYSIKENQESKKLMILIYKYHQRMLRENGSQELEVDCQAKRVTKHNILQFIREIITEGEIEEQIKEEAYQEQFLADISPCFSQGWNMEENINHFEQLSSSSKAFQHSIDEKKNYDIEGGFSSPFTQVILKQQFTNNDHSHISQISKFSYLSQQPSLFQKAVTYGHFLHGDQIYQIKDIISKQGQAMAIIRWKERFSEYQPLDSLINIEDIRQHSPLSLSIFYSRLIEQKEKSTQSQQSQA